jgi:NAD(P)-dependent dehydrogenase (short-subunit alcohol dehydrogenase family)
MEGCFAGKTALITGGASGIGKATALAFAAEGANVVIATSTIVDKATALAEEIQQTYGVGALGLRCDVRIESDVENMVRAAVDAFGTLDIAFNNAGVGPDGVTIPLVPLTNVTERDWDWIMDVDLKGVFLCMKYELRQMKLQGFGSIVNTASTAGIKAMGNFGAYSPAKAGLIQLTKCAAVEAFGTGIRCNVVCPGPTLGTGMADRMFGKADEVTPGENGIPPLVNKPEDIAEVVLTLCSDSCTKITGNVVTADGGLDVI